MDTNEVTNGPCISDSCPIKSITKNCKTLIAGTAFFVKQTCLLILMNKLNVLVVLILKDNKKMLKFKNIFSQKYNG